MAPSVMCAYGTARIHGKLRDVCATQKPVPHT